MGQRPEIPHLREAERPTPADCLKTAESLRDSSGAAAWGSGKLANQPPRSPHQQRAVSSPTAALSFRTPRNSAAVFTVVRRALVCIGLALTLSGSAAAKGFTRAVLIGADGRSVEIHASESTIDGLLSKRGTAERIRGGYVRLFFVGGGDFPANPARYYPAAQCVRSEEHT